MASAYQPDPGTDRSAVSRKLIFLPEAEMELLEAVEVYEEQRRGRGQRFLDAVNPLNKLHRPLHG